MLTRTFLAVALSAAVAASTQAAPKKAAGETVESVMKKVQAQQKKTQTLQATFRQEKELALMAKPEVSTGSFLFSKPNNVLWSYDTPKRVQMIIAAGTLTTYYPELNKAEKIDIRRFEDRIFKYMGASGAIDELARYFNFTFIDRASEPSWILDLSPKSRAVARRVKSIRIWIDKQKYLTTKFEYVEGDGDVTRYEFKNIKLNEPVAPSRFSVAMPSTVRIEQMKIQ